MLAGAQEQPTGGCSGLATTCGNLTISDPFWIVDIDTGISCGSGPSGSPDFKVACYNNTPVLRGYGLTGFQIASISYQERSLRLIDLSKLNLLHVSNSCDVVPNWNTSNKIGRAFRISSINLNLI
jgi:hypothetical protein